MEIISNIVLSIEIGFMFFVGYKFQEVLYEGRTLEDFLNDREVRIGLVLMIVFFLLTILTMDMAATQRLENNLEY